MDTVNDSGCPNQVLVIGEAACRADLLTVWSPAGHRPVGCSREHPRRGTAYVHRRRRIRGLSGPRSVGLLARHMRVVGQLALLGKSPVSYIEQCLALGPGADAYCGIQLWPGAQRWARFSVPTAYATHHKRLRELMPYDAVSLKTLVRVADARAEFAEYSTGRHCRPTNATLAARTGLSERQVRRAGRWLLAMGCATEILRGRQRTKRERLATWRLGSRQRGWASVWALHEPRPVVDNSRDANGLWQPVFSKLSTHPRRGSLSVENGSFKDHLPTKAPVHNRHMAGQSPHKQRGAPRHTLRQRTKRRNRNGAVDEGGRLLAVRWLAEGQTPAWAGQHTSRGWARTLAGPAAHGWTPDDLNLMIREWKTVGKHYLPEKPYRPIGLVAAILRWHGDLNSPPAALDRARHASEQARQTALAQAEREATAAAHAQAASAEQRAAAIKLFADSQRQRRHNRRNDPYPPADS